MVSTCVKRLKDVSFLSSDIVFFVGRVVSVVASVLSVFCVTSMCSSESICMSRFSGIYRIVSNSFPALV